MGYVDKANLSRLLAGLKLKFAPDPLLAYPVGSIYMSINATSPATLFGGTWERIEGKFLLSATDNGSSGASQAAGNTGGAATVTLTSAQSGVPAHAHGLNSHTHSVGAHKHTVPEHGHTYTRPTVSSSGAITNGISGGKHDHNVQIKYAHYGTSGSSLDTAWGDGSNYTSNWSRQNADGSHTHNLPNHTHTLTGGSVANKEAFDTNNSTAFDSGAASGNTANNTAANASEAHNNMPPYLSVYVWKRTA